MNKTIFQLGIQAKREFNEHVAECERLGKAIEWVSEERLAELIVQECIKEIGYKSAELLDVDFYPHYQERLKKHFGIGQTSVANFSHKL